MERDPGRAVHRVHQRVQDGPVGDGVGTVLHRLCLPIGARHAAAVQVVAADHDRRFHLPARHELVEDQSCLRALAVTEPADAGGQSLELHPLLRHRQPAAQVRLLRKRVEEGAVRRQDVLRVTRERHPPERPLPLTEERTDVGRNETGIGECVAHAAFLLERAQVVAVVEDGCRAGGARASLPRGAPCWRGSASSTRPGRERAAPRRPPGKDRRGCIHSVDRARRSGPSPGRA